MPISCRKESEKLKFLLAFSELYVIKAHDFKQAIAGYKKCLEIVPDDGPSHVYLKRCESYLAAPPPKDWDGVFILTDKG